MSDEALAAAAAKRASAEREGARRALQRLRDSQARFKTAAAELNVHAAESKTRHTEALLHLKASVDAVHEDMRAKVETYRCAWPGLWVC